MRILLIGANGFIGSSIARHLLARGHALRLAARNVEHTARLFADSEIVRADLNHLVRAGDWAPLLAGCVAWLECRLIPERHTEAAYDTCFGEVVSAQACADLQKARAGAGGYNAVLDPEALNGTNRMQLYVFGNDERQQVRLVALLDNLGKGASGAAVQNLNLMLGLPEGAGL